jgi:DNA repair exonuclease SbcCD ATPase subunit
MPNQILCDTHIAKQGLRLLTEATDIEQKKGNPKALGVLEGPCSDFTIATRNDNLYVRKLWENVIASDYVKEALDTRTLFGEIDHPENRLEISMQEAAINCTRLWIDESQNCLMGTFDILPTEKGKLLKSICDYGSIVGVSSRGVGDLEPTPDGKNKVNEDTYLFVTFDAVVQPAAIKARQRYTALTESEKKKVDSIVHTLTESIQNATDEFGIKSIEAIAERLQLKENQQFKKVCETKRKMLKKDENDNIIKENGRLKIDLEEAYRKLTLLESQNDKNNIGAELSLIKSSVSSIKKMLESSNNIILSDQQKALTEAEALREKVLTLTKELKTLYRENTRISNLYEQSQKDIQTHLSEITELKRIADYAVKFVENCKVSFTENQSRFIKIKDRLNESQNEVSTLTQKLQESNSRISTLVQERDSVKEKLTENTNIRQQSEVRLENLLNEYISQKEQEFGIDLSTARGNMSQIKSLRDVDVFITETLKNTRKSTQSAKTTVMSGMLRENQIQQPNNIADENTQTEDENVVRTIFKHFRN